MKQQVETGGNAVSRRAQDKRRRAIKGSLIAILGLAALGALVWYLTHQTPTTGGGGGRPGGPGGPGGGRGGPPATTVGVAAATHADIPVVLDALGTVQPAATVTVRPQVSGVLQQLHFTEGQTVKAGQLLATIDPRQFEMSLMQASGQRQRDEAQLDNARLSLQRFRTLLGQDSIARQDVDTQAALVKQLEGTVTADRATEGTAKLNLGYSQVKAPISGRVGLRAVDVGNVVNPSDANGLVLITQVSPIDVEFAVPQDQVPEVQTRAASGAPLPVQALDRARTATLDSGRFAALDNQVDTQTGTVKAKARFANEKLALFPSQFVNVRLLLRTIKDAIVIPVTALRHGSKGDYVYVLNSAEHTVALRPVTRGQSTVDKVEITAGLQFGEKVITEGADRLKDGAKVVLPGEQPTFGGGKDGKRQRGGSGPREGSPLADASAPAMSSSASVDASAPSADGHRRRKDGSTPP
jgi:multidrug efflux system membrane fusion protein